MEHELWAVLTTSVGIRANVRKYSGFIREFTKLLSSSQINYLIHALIDLDFPHFVLWILENHEFTILNDFDDYWNSRPWEFDIFWDIFEKSFSRFKSVIEILVKRPDFNFERLHNRIIFSGNMKWINFFVKQGYTFCLTNCQEINYRSTSNYLTKRLKLDLPKQPIDDFLIEAKNRRERFWRESMKTLWMSAKRLFGRDIAHLLTSFLISTKFEGCWEI